MEMIDNFLKRCVGDAPFQGEFAWCRGNLIEKESKNFLCTLINGKTRPVSFNYFVVRNTPNSRLILAFNPSDLSDVPPLEKKTIDFGYGTLRLAHDPHLVRGLLGVYALATLILFGATLCLRAAQTVVILAAVIFRVFKESYPHRFEKDFAENFACTVDAQFRKQKAELKKIQEDIELDFRAAAAMEVSALVGTFTQDMNRVMRMQVVFSTAESLWNKGVDPSRTPLSAFIRFWKQLDSYKEKMSTELFLEKTRVMLEESGSGFFLYQCAQPRSENNQSRVRLIGKMDNGTLFFSSYDDLQDHYRRLLPAAESHNS